IALLYIGEQVFWLTLRSAFGLPMMSSEFLHLSGAFWGGLIGVALVKLKWVDCEGWDGFSLMAKRRKLAEDWKKRGEEHTRREASIRKSIRAQAKALAELDSEPDPEERAEAVVRRVHKLIDRDDIAGALAAYDKAARTLSAWPPKDNLLAMI